MKSPISAAARVTSGGGGGFAEAAQGWQQDYVAGVGEDFGVVYGGLFSTGVQ